MCVVLPILLSGHRPEMDTDEGMTNGPPIFTYLVFGLGRVPFEKLLRPIKAVV
jgi:hypothetical protein